MRTLIHCFSNMKYYASYQSKLGSSPSRNWYSTVEIKLEWPGSESDELYSISLSSETLSGTEILLLLMRSHVVFSQVPGIWRAATYHTGITQWHLVLIVLNIGETLQLRTARPGYDWTPFNLFHQMTQFQSAPSFQTVYATACEWLKAEYLSKAFQLRVNWWGRVSECYLSESEAVIFFYKVWTQFKRRKGNNTVFSNLNLNYFGVIQVTSTIADLMS